MSESSTSVDGPIEVVDGVFAGAPMSEQDADELRSFLAHEARKRSASALGRDLDTFDPPLTAEEIAQGEANRRKPLTAGAIATIEADIMNAANEGKDYGMMLLDACLLLREVNRLLGRSTRSGVSTPGILRAIHPAGATARREDGSEIREGDRVTAGEVITVTFTCAGAGVPPSPFRSRSHLAPSWRYCLRRRSFRACLLLPDRLWSS
jgi:hypothetical protein